MNLTHDHYIYYGGQESLRRNGVALIISKSPKWSTRVQSQGKAFNITVIQFYAPTTNAKEAEVEQFYEDLEDLLELTPKKKKKRCPIHQEIRMQK